MNNNKDIADEELIENFKSKLFENTQLDSFVIGTTEVEQIFNKCINYLS